MLEEQPLQRVAGERGCVGFFGDDHEGVKPELVEMLANEADAEAVERADGGGVEQTELFGEEAIVGLSLEPGFEG